MIFILSRGKMLLFCGQPTKVLKRNHSKFEQVAAVSASNIYVTTSICNNFMRFIYVAVYTGGKCNKICQTKQLTYTELSSGDHFWRLEKNA